MSARKCQDCFLCKPKKFRRRRRKTRTIECFLVAALFWMMVCEDVEAVNVVGDVDDEESWKKIKQRLLKCV
jgi:hypothetical protein